MKRGADNPRTFRLTLALSDTLLKNASAQPRRREDDPLQLNLPPLLGGPDAITPAALRGLGAMYLQSELEQAGIILVAELLSDAADNLGLMSSTAAVKLDQFGRRRRDWYDRARREPIFARIFGMGSVAGSPGDINREFQSVFANFCAALVRYAADLDWRRVPSPAEDTRVRQAALAVVVNLTPRQYGNTLLAGRLIGEQLQAAIGLLGDPGICAHFASRDMWDTVRKILGSLTPDLGRLLARGQSGMHLLDWLADALRKLAASRPGEPLAGAGDNAFLWAGQWLDATGLRETLDTARRVL